MKQFQFLLEIQCALVILRASVYFDMTRFHVPPPSCTVFSSCNIVVSYPAHVSLPVRIGLVKQSQISWAHSQNVVRLNEIVKSLLIIITSLTTAKFWDRTKTRNRLGTDRKTDRDKL